MQAVVGKKRILVVLLVSLALQGCSKPILLADESVPEDRLAIISRGNGVRITKIGGRAVRGSRFAVGPGTYVVDFETKQNAKAVEQVMDRIYDEGVCRISVQVQPGEEVSIRSKAVVSKPQWVGGYEVRSVYTDVRISSSLSDSIQHPRKGDCAFKFNCRHANLTQVVPVGCDD